MRVLFASFSLAAAKTTAPAKTQLKVIMNRKISSIAGSLAQILSATPNSKG